MNLTDRVRGVLTGSPRAPGPVAASSAPPQPNATSGLLERTLGGEWRVGPDGPCFIVERSIGASGFVGRQCVGDIAARFRRDGHQAALLTGGALTRAPFVFVDLETTGLSGGAGTFAFLVGCAWFTAEGSFFTRQFLMTSPASERALLQAVAAELQQAGALVSFNGKSFDAPVLETRYLFHRLPWPGAATTHVDALHPARQFWGEPPTRSNCSLTTLEAQVLGAGRGTDIAGFEVPARYFHFLRTGDASPLAAVLEHNRHDLLALAGLTARLLDWLIVDPTEVEDAQAACALGRIYWRAGSEQRAEAAFTKALELTGGGRDRRELRLAALHALALCKRRARRHAEAASLWSELLETPGCPPSLARAAAEALAIHHEHRARNLPAARAFAARSLNGTATAAWRDATQRRLTRIDRKMERGVGRTVIDPPMQTLWMAAGMAD
jgi:uncharacterized protein YprB with RNaseH-like and TPR domain